MKSPIISAALAILLSSTATVTFAQAPGQQQGGGDKAQGGAPATQPQSSQPQRGGGGESQPRANSAPNQAGKQSESQQPQRGNARKAEGNGAERNGRSENSAQRKSADTKSDSKATQRNAQSKEKTGSQAQGETTDNKNGARRNRAAETPKANQPNDATRKNGARNNAANGTKPGDQNQPSQKQADRQPGDINAARRVTLDDQRRNDVRTRILAQKVQHVRNPGFDHRQGSRIPRSVMLFGIPVAIATIVPEYAGYRYFIADDDICIVDPATYEVVTVIDSGSGPRGGPVEARNTAPRAALALNTDQRTFLIGQIGMPSGPSLGIGGIAVNMAVPARVELREFTPVVVERIPELRSYRYFMNERQLAIVDPDQQKIVLIVDQQ